MYFRASVQWKKLLPHNWKSVWILMILSTFRKTPVKFELETVLRWGSWKMLGQISCKQLYSSEENEMCVKSNVCIRVIDVEKVIFRCSKMPKTQFYLQTLCVRHWVVSTSQIEMQNPPRISEIIDCLEKTTGVDSLETPVCSLKKC